MTKLRQLLGRYRETIDYLFWGVMTTLVSWGSYSVFSLLLAPRMAHVAAAVLVANILSWICAAGFAFVTNKLWVFRSPGWSRAVLVPELGKFFSARLATGIFEQAAVPGLMALGVDQTLFGVEGMVSKMIVSVLVVVLNYILSKLFIFNRPGK